MLLPLLSALWRLALLALLTLLPAVLLLLLLALLSALLLLLLLLPLRLLTMLSAALLLSLVAALITAFLALLLRSAALVVVGLRLGKEHGRGLRLVWFWQRSMVAGSSGYSDSGNTGENGACHQQTPELCHRDIP
jgi:hypothetical protein